MYPMKGMLMKQLKLPEDIKWVAVERNNGFPIETSYYKTVFNINNVPEQAVIQISANTRYILYVNGTELIRGPCKGDHWHQYCDEVDITPHLVKGKNIIAVKVTAYWPLEVRLEDCSNAGPLWAMAGSMGPMLLVHGAVDGTDISTGRADWYFKNDTAITWNFDIITHWMGCTEIVDGKQLQSGWEKDPEIAGDFSKVIPKWDNFLRFGEIKSLFLYERPIDYLIRKEITGLSVISGSEFPLDKEIVFSANSKYETIVSYNNMTTAFLYLNCRGGAGSKISLKYSEAFEMFDGERYYKEKRSDVNGELRGVSDVYYPGGVEECYSPTWFRSFRYITVSIETANEPLTLYPLKMIETRYPLEDKVQFNSSQPWLQKVWDISLRTLELCMHETYEDCPYYEQLQYTQDTRLQMLFNHIISNDSVMQHKAIFDYHASILPEGILQSRYPSEYPLVIPIFALHWIFMLEDYYMATGDITILERYRPTMENVLAWFKRKTGPLGLVENLGYWDFCDWTDAWEDIAGEPRASRYGPSTVQNLVYAYALETGAWIMDTLDLNNLAERYRIEKTGILDKIGSLCWSVGRGLYKEGPEYEEYSQHAQLWAVLSDLATGDKAKEIMQKVLEDKSLIPCSFVMQFYVFRALEKAEMYEKTEQLWEMWKNLIDMDCVTVPEIPSKYNRSECHAWGSLILHELPRKFLGISPLLPGYDKVKIKPMGLFIKNISGSVPTPHGNVMVKWNIDGNKITLEGNTPVRAQIILPDGLMHTVEAGSFTYTSILSEE